MKKIFLALLPFIVLSCVHRLPTPEGIKDISTSEYEDYVETKTQKQEVYDGLYNKLTVQATRLDADMSENLVAYQAKLSQWNLEKYKEEKGKIIAKHSDSTEFFISFYTPERKHDDLAFNKTSWKVYLDVGGQRYEGKVTKLKGLFLDIEALYPFHNRWSSAYSVLFPVSTPATDGKPVTLTLTGPLATTQLNF
ncbi:hypothetical protein [Pseudobdellovibrio sp. HCB154]|uniref:hypothetical protein n=1 Tax=Pseudobdellovibrio sp. HCB154 TaxID=3386277 RepID=UPI003916F877